MTRKERATLREAAELIKKELAEGREVRIPSFGRFCVSWFEASTTHPMDEDGSYELDILVPVARFRGFAALREAMGGRRRFCMRPLKHRYKAIPCKRIAGHDGECSQKRD